MARGFGAAFHPLQIHCFTMLRLFLKQAGFCILLLAQLSFYSVKGVQNPSPNMNCATYVYVPKTLEVQRSKMHSLYIYISQILFILYYIIFYYIVFYYIVLYDTDIVL